MMRKILKEIDISKIDMKDLKYIVHYRPEIQKLAENIRPFGLNEPVGVTDTGNSYIMLYGFARMLVYKQFKNKTIPANVYDAATDFERMEISINDNRFYRNFSPYEKALFIKKTREELTLSHSEKQKLYEMMALPRSEERIEKYVKILELPEKIIENIHKEKTDVNEIFLFLNFRGGEMQSIFDLFKLKLRMNYNEIKRALNYLHDIALRERKTVADILTDFSCIDSKQAAIEGLKKAALPSLFAAEKEFAGQLSRLGVPGNVKVQHSKNFEKSELYLNSVLKDEQTIDVLVEFLLRLKSGINEVIL